jgi:hypothetical protein
MNSVLEIRRERVFIPPEMTCKEIQEKDGLSSDRAWLARIKGFFIRNYSKKHVIIDPENFNPSISYSTAKTVFGKKFAWNSVAATIKDDLVQEAVTRMYELNKEHPQHHSLILILSLSKMSGPSAGRALF